MLLTAYMFTGCYFSLRYFVHIGRQVSPETNRSERRKWDVRAVSALELGFVFCILTMVTGMLFSLAQWGALWQWDPRQTSFLIAMLIYGAYFALRGAFSDPDRRANQAAAYMLAAMLPMVFLIFVFPRLPQIEAVSFHPSDTVMKGQLKGQYGYVTIAILLLTSALSV
jgi:heme exporter protein C